MARTILSKSISSGARRNANPPLGPLRDCKMPSLDSRWRILARYGDGLFSVPTISVTCRYLPAERLASFAIRTSAQMACAESREQILGVHLVLFKQPDRLSIPRVDRRGKISPSEVGKLRLGPAARAQFPLLGESDSGSTRVRAASIRCLARKQPLLFRERRSSAFLGAEMVSALQCDLDHHVEVRGDGAVIAAPIRSCLMARTSLACPCAACTA